MPSQPSEGIGAFLPIGLNVFYRQLITTVLLIVAVLPAQAVTFIIGSVPPPIVVIAVDDGIGPITAAVDLVRFTVPAANVGDGTPITGTPRMRIIVASRAAPANSRLSTVTTNSSTPLSNGFATIPFSTISWTASDADIPSGVFNDGVQTLVTFFNSRVILNFHTFQYSNASVLQSGTYTGRVTYTITMP